jgi:hypothetical protein
VCIYIYIYHEVLEEDGLGVQYIYHEPERDLEAEALARRRLV